MYPYQFWLMERSMAQRRQESNCRIEYDYQVKHAFDFRPTPQIAARLMEWLESLVERFKAAKQGEVFNQSACCEG
jgi:hypothetical protein